ncbi:MAG: RNA polymerase sigma factor, partial [Actinomycetota bacterium]
LHDAGDAEEAMQETFLRAYKALPRFNGRYQLNAWLNRIATNICVDQARSRAKWPALVTLVPESTTEADDGPEDIVVAGNEKVDDAIGDLQPLHQEALFLRAVEGMSHREMAGRLDMSPEQVKALLHRARTSFKRAWRRAGGWVAAPVGAVRSALRHGSRASHGPSEVLSLGSGAAPMLVEKVTASAMVVAVALTSLSVDSEVSSEVAPANIAMAQRDTTFVAPETTRRRARVARPSEPKAPAEATAAESPPVQEKKEGRNLRGALARVFTHDRHELRPREDSHYDGPAGDIKKASHEQVVDRVRNLLGRADQMTR